MERKVEALLREALALPEADRASLAGALLESLEPQQDVEVEAAWREEVAARVAALEAGEVETVPPWEEVGDRLFAKLAVPLDDRLLALGVQRAVAVSLFVAGSLSLAQAAKLAGLSIEELVELLGREEVAAVDYPPDELAEELDAAG